MVDAAALLTALTTEHFTLQGSRASTIGESTARAALFVGALSSALIALVLIAQAAGMGSAFDVLRSSCCPCSTRWARSRSCASSRARSRTSPTAARSTASAPTTSASPATTRGCS